MGHLELLDSVPDLVLHLSRDLHLVLVDALLGVVDQGLGIIAGVGNLRKSEKTSRKPSGGRCTHAQKERSISPAFACASVQ